MERALGVKRNRVLAFALIAATSPAPACLPESKLAGGNPLCIISCTATQTAVEDNTSDTLNPQITGGSRTTTTSTQQVAN